MAKKTWFHPIGKLKLFVSVCVSKMLLLSLIAVYLLCVCVSEPQCHGESGRPCYRALLNHHDSPSGRGGSASTMMINLMIYSMAYTRLAHWLHAPEGQVISLLRKKKKQVYYVRAVGHLSLFPSCLPSSQIGVPTNRSAALWARHTVDPLGPFSCR